MHRAARLLGHVAPSPCAAAVAAAAAVSASPVSYNPGPYAAYTPPNAPTAGYKFINIQHVTARVAVVTLYRPRALNALNDELMADLGRALRALDESCKVGCIVLTGAGRAFAAGADIKEMKDKSYFEMSTVDKIAPWEAITGIKVPIIAAVNGFALGGGCEIAMMCDIVVASEKAKFGQPEIAIGTIPGAGGTQRLTKAVGKSKAMELVLTGGMMKADEALRFGLVSHVVPHEQLIARAQEIATKIASMSLPIVKLAKESVNAAYNTTLDQGMRVERRLFHSTFALDDQTEGMNAFASKRKPKWKHQ